MTCDWPVVEVAAIRGLLYIPIFNPDQDGQARDRMLRLRLAVVVVVTVVGLAAVIGAAFIPSAWKHADYWSNVAISVGAALLLVPVIFWMERQIGHRLDAVELSLAGGKSALRGARTISAETKWEVVYAALEEVRMVHLDAELVVEVVGHGQWLGFSCHRQLERGKSCSTVAIYFHDPTNDDRSRLDAFVNWFADETGRDLLTAVSSEVRGKGRRFDGRQAEEQVFESLREKIVAILDPA